MRTPLFRTPITDLLGIHQSYLTGDPIKGMLDFGPAAIFADKIEPMESLIDRFIDDAATASGRPNQRNVNFV